MTRRPVLLALAGIAALALAVWALTVGLERLLRPDVGPASDADAAESAAAPVRHITATLFYASEDAQYLVPVQREVPYGDGAAEQGREIVLAQIQMAPPQPLTNPMPAETTLRQVYVTSRGEAFVDLGPEVAIAHRGGSAAELLTVYALVNAVTANLPAIRRVQILIDGREAETLAGHVDLRRPLQQNQTLVYRGTP